MARPKLPWKGCSIEGCKKKHKSRGLCDKHYYHFRLKGDPLKLSRRENTPFNGIEEEGFAAFFWSQAAITANPDKCWIWQRTFVNHGYGQIQLGGKRYRAHRLAWQLANGHPPAVDLEILHSCDNPSCINPNHLSEGTHKQNMAEALERRRLKVGSECSWTDLTEVDIIKIRQLLADGSTGRAVARMYNMSEPAISEIKNRRKWKHVI